MVEPLTPTALRQLMAAADDLPDLNAASWNARRDADLFLRNWRGWLGAFLDAVEVQPVSGVAAAMSQAEAEARGLV